MESQGSIRLPGRDRSLTGISRGPRSGPSIDGHVVEVEGWGCVMGTDRRQECEGGIAGRVFLPLWYPPSKTTSCLLPHAYSVPLTLLHAPFYSTRTPEYLLAPAGTISFPLRATHGEGGLIDLGGRDPPLSGGGVAGREGGGFAWETWRLLP